MGEDKEALRSLIDAMNRLTAHIGALIDQNSALIEALADMEDQEDQEDQEESYLSGESLSG